MDIIDHPSARLDPEIAQQLSDFAYLAEISGDLHPKQLELLHTNRWLRMFIPRKYDGLELTLPQVVRLEEALSWADGSTAWVATLCGGAGWFVGFVDSAVAKDFFTGNNLCVAGSDSITGTAELVNDEYRINGSWPFASGALHATAFTVNCRIQENGLPVLNADGTLCVLSFLLKPEEVVIQKTWGASGMIATASHSFTVTNILVPANRSFQIHASAVKIDAPVYRFPFLQLAESTLAANISGMSVRFIELAQDQLSNRDGSNAEDMPLEIVRHQHEQLSHLRQLFFSNIDAAWHQLTVTNIVRDEALQGVSDKCLNLVRACSVTIDTIYPLCTAQGPVSGSELNRVWRNIHTALTHALFRNRIESGKPMGNEAGL